MSKTILVKLNMIELIRLTDANEILLMLNCVIDFDFI